MENKHTPGPWFWHYGIDGDTKMDVLTSSTSKVCDFGDCETYYPIEGTPPNEADAKLIAAAPELLEALIEVVAISDRKHDAWDKAKAAIKKATE